MNQKLSKSQLLQVKKKELELLKAKKKIENDLPHLYGHKFYKWQRTFIDSTNRVNLLTAANQIGKSSAGIRRCITNATEPERWEKMWGKGVKPKMFWYFYPDQETLQKEFDTKWEPEWLPRNEMKDDAKYGWRIQKEKGVPKALYFNSGVIVFFQYYTKKLSAVQAGSVHEIYCDEEMPLAFYDELMFRLVATNGIFNSTFTPTLNQLFWKQVMQPGSKMLPHAMKLTVSMYDCLKYEDGSPSTAFTIQKIEQARANCKNETEVQRRIYGKFVTEEGRTFFAFDFDKHMVPRYDITNWHVYSGVDYGSGGSNHPSGILFVAVRPDYRKGVVFRAWRGDDAKTTAGDLFNKHEEMSVDLRITQSTYDPASADFGTIAERNGVNFIKADKTRDVGEAMVNSLFKHGMLEIFDDDVELMKLAGELAHLMKSNQNSENKTGDDLADPLRYTCMLIPWDLEAINEAKQAEAESKVVQARPKTEQEVIAEQIRERRGDHVHGKEHESQNWDELEEEFEYWQEQY